MLCLLNRVYSSKVDADSLNMGARLRDYRDFSKRSIYIDTLGINITGNAKEDQKAIEKTLRGYIQTVC